MTTALSASELAHRVRHSTRARVSESLCAMFAAYWCDRGLCEETEPGRFRLTEEGWRVAAGLLESEPVNDMVATGKAA